MLSDPVELFELAPNGFRTSVYRATAILTPYSGTLNYELPCIRDTFTVENVSALRMVNLA